MRILGGNRRSRIAKTVRSSDNTAGIGRRGKLASAAFTTIELLESRTLLSTVVVNSTADTAGGAGVVTLRGAIATANAATSATTITFDPTAFASLQTITLNGTQLEISAAQPVTIIGPSEGVTISGNNASRVLSIDFGAGEVNIQNVNFTKGNAPDYGGGIENKADLTLTSSTVSDCLAADGGGGIFTDSYLGLQNSSIISNTVTGGYGAGIENLGDDTNPTISLTAVTVSGNTLDGGYGAGIASVTPPMLDSFPTFVSLEDVTVANNTLEGVGGSGGGLYLDDEVSFSQIDDSTISGNSAQTAAGVWFGLNPDFTGTVLSNTIIAGNGTTSTTYPDVGGAPSSDGNNLIGIDDNTTGWLPSDLTGTGAHPLNADLGALADNGGPTQTMLPDSDSPAIAAGSVSLIPSGLTTDQRGYARTFDGTVDIGAVEEETTPIVPGTATHLAIVSQPSTATIGAIGTIVVDVEDSTGGLVASDNSDVLISIATGPGGATIEGTLTVQASGGVATFNNLDLDTAGAYTLKVTDGALTAATSSTITVSAPSGLANPEALVFAQEPSDVPVNTAISPPVVVDIVDSSGSIVGSEETNVTITIESGPSGAAIPGQPVAQAGGGVATFNDLSFNMPGTYTILATDGSLAQAYSTTFTVGGGGGSNGGENTGPTHLVFAQQPTSSTVGSTIAPPITVEVCNNSGQIVAGDNSNVTIAVAGGLIGGGTLNGMLTEQAQNGIATFGDLSISKAGSYALTATDGSLTSVTSAMFSITTAPAVTINPVAVATIPGNTATFSAEAIGTPPPTVQWQVSGDGGATFATIAGATSTTYSFTTASYEEGYQYEAVFTNTFGSATTAAAALTFPQISSQSDLVISTGSASLPETVVAGTRKKASVKVVITNEGDDFRGNVELDLFANTLTDLEGAPVSLDAMTKPNFSLKSQKSKTIDLRFKTWPASLAEGENHLVAELIMPSGTTSIGATPQTVDVISNIAQPAILVGVTPPMSVFADDPNLP